MTDQGLSDGLVNEDILLGSVNEPLLMSDSGIEALIASGDEPFSFGDKFKFSARTVGVVSAEVTALGPFALLAVSDTRSPELQLRIDGELPESGSVIAPRPKMSMILKDSNGVDMDTFRFVVSKNAGPFEEITDYTVNNPDQASSVPIFYAPVLSVGRYLYRIWAQDLNGNALGGDEPYAEFIFFVEEPPDLDPPEVEIRLNQEIIVDGVVLRQQPEIEVRLTDYHGIDSAAIQLSFARTADELIALPRDAYELVFDEAHPKQATVFYAPSLANGEYRIQFSASDTSENIYEGEVFRFQLDQDLELEDVRNVPNPVRTDTFFTYDVVQTPEQVTIKIYTVTGKLVRTIDEASAKRGYNETYWDGRDEDGVRLANGTYFYKVAVEAENRQIERVGRLAILR